MSVGVVIFSHYVRYTCHQRQTVKKPIHNLFIKAANNIIKKKILIR
jgi:hypothetical protein